MGVQASVASIYVTFDQPDVMAGCKVTGKAYLSVNQSEISCVSIGCKIIGQEKTTVKYTVTVGSGDNRRTETRTAHDRRTFMNMNFCLKSIAEGRILQGQYEYPFEFIMPSNSPASMFAGGAGEHCSVRYTMEVWLDRPGLLRWDIKNKRGITVIRPPPTGSRAPHYMEPCRLPLFSCCCWNRGDILLGGSTEASIVCAGEVSSVKYAVQNHSTVDIKGIEITLLEIVSFHAQGHRETRSHNLYYKRLNPEETKLDLTKISSRHGKDHDYMQDLRIMSHLLQSDQTKLNYNIPSNARTSYSGNLIHVKHILQIKVCTTFGTANPIISCMLQLFSKIPANIIYNSNKPNTELPELPQGWAPTVSESIAIPNLHITSAVESVQEDENQPVIYSPINPTSTSTEEASQYTYSNLIEILKKTYDPCGEIEKYILYNNNNNNNNNNKSTSSTSNTTASTTTNCIENLDNEQLYMIFKSINDVYDQQRCADIISTHIHTITCIKLSRIAAACKDMYKREIVEKFLSSCVISDKNNAHLVKAELSPFQYMTIEKYFTVEE